MTRTQRQAAYNAALATGNAMLKDADKTPFSYVHSGESAWYVKRAAAYDFMRNRIDEIDAIFSASQPAS